MVKSPITYNTGLVKRPSASASEAVGMPTAEPIRVASSMQGIMQSSGTVTLITTDAFRQLLLLWCNDTG